MKITLIGILGALFFISFSTQADTAQDVLKLTNGKHVKMVWLRRDTTNQNFYIWKWDTKSSTQQKLVQTPVKLHDSPRITPDGNSVLFSESFKGGLYLANFETGELTLLRSSGTSGQCWKDPLTSELWVFYRRVTNDKFVSFNKFSLSKPDSEVVIWNTPVPGCDSADVAFPSFSRDGQFMAAYFVWPNMGFLTINTLKYTDVCSPCCNISISPDNSYHFAYFTNNHQTLYLDKYDQNNGLKRVGDIRLSEAIFKKFGGTLESENSAHWTNNVRFMSSSGPWYDDERMKFTSIRLFKLSDSLKEVEDVVKITDTVNRIGGGDGFGSEWAWIEPDQSIPSTVYFTSDTSGASVLEKSFDIDCPDENCECQAECDKKWVTVSVQKNDSKLHFVNSVKISELASGVYTATVILKIGNRKETYDVVLTIEGTRTVGEIFINSDKTVIEPGDSCHLTCSAVDQFKKPFQTKFTWGVMGGGTIDSNGVFISSGIEGTYKITARSVIDTSKVAFFNVQVINGIPLPPGLLKELIVLTDGKGSSYLPLADTQYIEKNGKLTNSNIYPGARVTVGNKEYVWTTLKSESATWFDSTAADNFASYCFLPVISDLETKAALEMRFHIQVKLWVDDSLIKVIGGGDMGVDKYSPVLSLKKGTTNICLRLGDLTGANGLKARFVNVSKEDMVTLKTKSLVVPDTSILHLISPNNGGTYNAGDTVTVKWSAVMSRIDGVLIKLSTDKGKTWEDLTEKSILPNNSSWGIFKWVVPNTYKDASMASNNCIIRVSSYNFPYYDNSDKLFTLGNASSATNLVFKNKEFRIYEDKGSVTIVTPEKKTCNVDVYSLNGTVIYSLHGSPGILKINKKKLPGGIYLMRVSSQSFNTIRKVNVY